MKQELQIGIIGAGNLGISLAKGLTNNFISGKNLWLSRRKTDLLEEFKKHGVHILSNNIELVKNCQIIIIAVKPYKIDQILKEIKMFIHTQHILISVVSGITINYIQNNFEQQIPIYRIIPNTAIAINESMSCIATSDSLMKNKKLVAQIFSTLGKTIFINEELSDAATVLAACGIAFAMRFIRAMVQGGIEIGFDAQTAGKISYQTVKGAAELLIKNGLHPEAEIDKVTTPKGYTISGLNEMEHNGFSSALIQGILNSYNKIN